MKHLVIKNSQHSTRIKFIPIFILLICLFSLLPLSTHAEFVVPPKCSEEKVVYLTFDDGPTPKITGEILDVLKSEKVSATFFIVGKEVQGREEVLKRIYNEGHGIGLHTYSHNFKLIYQNPEAFINEMEKAELTINEVLGTNINFSVIRFPGGSAGRLNSNFYDLLTQHGYKIFDWNIDLKDGIKGSLSPDTFIDNAKKCQDKSTRRIILAHCNSNNINTVKALPGIIKYYHDEGYCFKTIDNDTSPYFFRFKK